MFYFLLIISLGCIIVGALGTFLPILPGAPLVFAGLFLLDYTYDFERFGTGILITLLILTLLASGIDFVSGTWGAKRVGASKAAVRGSLLGAIFGIFFGIVGLIFGPFIGALLGELWAGRNLVRAGQVGLATWTGMAIGMALKIGVVFSMLGLALVSFWV